MTDDDKTVTVELSVSELHTVVAQLGESVSWWQRRDPKGALVASQRKLYDRLLALSLDDDDE